MRTVTFADEDLCAWLNRSFVLVWFDLKQGADPDGLAALQPAYSKEEIAACPEGGGGTNVRTLFCAPDGTIRHGLQGWWPAAKFREECERGLACAAAETVDDARTRRERAAADFLREADSLARANPDEMKKPIRESPIGRQVAALRLRAQSYAPTTGMLGGAATSILQAWAQESKIRVLK